MCGAKLCGALDPLPGYGGGGNPGGGPLPVGGEATVGGRVGLAGPLSGAEDLAARVGRPPADWKPNGTGCWKRTYPDPANCRLAKHFRHERRYMFTFLYSPGWVDATNHPAERVMRMLVVIRKNWGGRQMCQAFCVNGHSCPCAAGDSGRWKSGNPGFGFPLSHGPQFFLRFGLQLLQNERFFRLSNATLRADPEMRVQRVSLGPVSPASRQRVWRNPVAQQNRKALQGSLPILHRPGPLPGNVLQRQK